ncbi:hypothetical protein [Rhizobium sp. LC145]|uniref:hypothetical protein n=1 Tax=Rhizobium sp. LC145 TaxID=1120688 RepID=UPI00062A3268|nr:hypothetical protein [Rhizobium sp. LC145]KKX24336.1 hypothetical protein YH62_27705 [Rhizobium sp. LC145]TKT46153.1 hypothetical protein FDR95_23620 [Rhizobiaceae bacterium LC148]
MAENHLEAAATAILGLHIRGEIPALTTRQALKVAEAALSSISPSAENKEPVGYAGTLGDVLGRHAQPARLAGASCRTKSADDSIFDHMFGDHREPVAPNAGDPTITQLAEATATLVTSPGITAQFRQALADHGVNLPLQIADEDLATLIDADGKPVLVVDVDRERTDEDAAWIVGMIQVAVNTCGGFKAIRQPSGSEASAE